MKTKGPIRGMLEEGDKLYIILTEHAGYFFVPLLNLPLCAKIRTAYAEKTEISFTFDRDLKILDVD